MKPNSKSSKTSAVAARKESPKRARKAPVKAKEPTPRKQRVPIPPPAKPLAPKVDAANKYSYWQKNKYYVLAFVGALLLFAASTLLVRRGVFVDWRHAVFHFINDWPERLRPVFLAATFLGSSWAAVIGVVLAFGLRLYQLAWRLALSVLTAYGLLFLVQSFIDRHRPAEVVVDIQVRVAETGFMFPAAHAAIATVIALTLLPYLPNVWRWFIISVFIAVVAVARLYLGVQAPLDVLAGAALGLGVVCFWRILPRRIKKILHLK